MYVYSMYIQINLHQNITILELYRNVSVCVHVHMYILIHLYSGHTHIREMYALKYYPDIILSTHSKCSVD